MTLPLTPTLTTTLTPTPTLLLLQWLEAARLVHRMAVQVKD